MSYDISIRVKIEGLDQYAEITTPEYANPTYNLGRMFRACMDWDYEQGEYYKCSEIISNIERGIYELRVHRNQYLKYNPENGWGNLDGALQVLESCRECIYECAEEIPIEHLYFRW